MLPWSPRVRVQRPRPLRAGHSNLRHCLTELRSLALYSTTHDTSTFAIIQTKLYPRAGRRVSRMAAELGEHIRLETLDLSVFHFYHDVWGLVGCLNAFFGAHGVAHLQDLSLYTCYKVNSDVDRVLLLNKGSDGEVHFSDLTNLHHLRLGGHSVSAICRALTSLPSPSPHTFQSLEVSLGPWIHYAAIPYAYDMATCTVLHSLLSPNL
ncbi:hypothetical protein B0H19DRAFT_1264849 [Mycena capillaripes]|nr:hypothetical protein B0H19DRAFT_1264849 [Mycena capillaripes]